LEQFIERVCAVRVIAENEIMQEFLTDDDQVMLLSVSLSVGLFWLRLLETNAYVKLNPFFFSYRLHSIK
jgi:hypothetical protein